MSDTDAIKETIAYLKFWLGVVVFSIISLVGWLLANIETASGLKLFGASIGISAMTVLAFFMHKYIMRLISVLKET
uniref:Uncharacterized protein n=1 Tax=Candidatus Kentrum sp. FM TaxID=2126340 RepID=A0A450T153_9GAMM|nr:MAG: hypothetical protein BECKFM1743C_GA0114222_102686 [Candidatus Kentron sp. FM]VFJ62357.1 MAG: hypothetical protein BECKFM1743A_GA0114220_103052 [Candidatus Kentron sp. FM]VFK13926.1 MAG: hypothetical protein BECKFM1743B_GA0114221_102995 [Candidatus Kentron sp. FM]